MALASSPTTGPTSRQGWHQGAQRSSGTGNGDCSPSVGKKASVTVTGSAPTGSGALQRPQTGSSPAASLSGEPG
jgi:hypothetical protein